MASDTSCVALSPVCRASVGAAAQPKVQVVSMVTGGLHDTVGPATVAAVLSLVNHICAM